MGKSSVFLITSGIVYAKMVHLASESPLTPQHPAVPPASLKLQLTRPDVNISQDLNLREVLPRQWHYGHSKITKNPSIKAFHLGQHMPMETAAQVYPSPVAMGHK